ncbi:cittilin family RiPP precursor [Murinocardiopsis flavida]
MKRAVYRVAAALGIVDRKVLTRPYIYY